MIRYIGLIAAGALAFTSWTAAAGQGRSLSVQKSQGPRTTPASERGRTIPGRFIITLQPRTDARAVAAEHGARPDFVYTDVITGFSGQMSEAARSGLLRDNRVVRVEPDRPVRASAVQSWGLDRIDQRTLPLNDAYGVSATGRGVTAYVVDTGIRFDHSEFGGRAVRGYDAIGDGQNGLDCDGHGTHVAGTIGGASVGAAREARLVSVRVLDCEGGGAMSGVIAGLDWIARNGQRPGVVNLSLGGDPYTTIDDAVRGLISRGFAVAIAAGNDGLDACQSSPARVAEAITVGASGENDARPSWSNYGSCLDLFAPGVSIISAWNTGTTAGASLDGTSMATPHVAGAAALLLQSSPGLSPQAVRDALHANSTKGTVTSASSANNHLLFVGAASASAPTPSTDSGSATTGTSGDDRLTGSGGADRMSGGTGNDTYTVNNAGDIVTELAGQGDDRVLTSVDYTVPANVERMTGTGTAALVLRGTAAAESITANDAGNRIDGGSGIDRLAGGGGTDAIIGGGGSDTLSGAGGRDRFYFRTSPGPSDIDRIIDFASGDLIYLSTAAYPAAGPAGPLAAAAFREGASAADSSDRIVYNPATGALYYDADGSGSAAAVRFGTVSAGTTLSAASIVIY